MRGLTQVSLNLHAIESYSDAVTVVHLGFEGMSSQRARGEADQQGDGAHKAEVQGWELGRIPEEEVPRQSRLHLYPGVQGRRWTYGGCQPDQQSEIQREANSEYRTERTLDGCFSLPVVVVG